MLDLNQEIDKMESELDKLKKYRNLLESYTESAHNSYNAGTIRLEDTGLALEALKDDFDRLFPEAKKE
jgi:hypothetical protein